MQSRCNNPKDRSYQYYGAKGIKVCDRWNSVHNFLEDMGHPPEGKTIGRIDNALGYCPENCRWETCEEQNNNTSRSRFLTWQSKTQTIKSWCEELDLNQRNIHDRLRRGWTIDRTLTTPTPRGYKEAREDRLAHAKHWWHFQRPQATRPGRIKDHPAVEKRSKSQLMAERKNLEEQINKERIQKKAEREEQTSQVLELRAKGYAYRDIAAVMGLSKSTVGNIVTAARSGTTNVEE